MSDELPAPRVEIRNYPDGSWNVMPIRVNGDMASGLTFYWSKRSVVAAAKRWSGATTGPLVIDGEVVSDA